MEFLADIPGQRTIGEDQQASENFTYVGNLAFSGQVRECVYELWTKIQAYSDFVGASQNGRFGRGQQRAECLLLAVASQEQSC